MLEKLNEFIALWFTSLSSGDYKHHKKLDELAKELSRTDFCEGLLSPIQLDGLSHARILASCH